MDGALEPWRRRREARAWVRYSALAAEEKQLRHQAREVRLRAASALGDLGEHVSGAVELERRADRVGKQAAWYKRCRLTVRRYEERRSECGDWTFEGVCSHCGLVHTWPKSCGAHQVCASCARARSKRLARKLIPAIRLAHARAMTKWHAKGRPTGGMPLLTLMTLTVRSVDLGDLAARRKLISEAWNRFRSWWQATKGTKLQYAWTAECTEGSAGQGHVHVHVVTMLPFVDYKQLNAAWERATKGHGGHVDFARSRTDAKRAAFYIAKYASKGVKFSRVQTAAAWVEAQHGRRGVSTSREWWWVDPVQHGPWHLTLRPSAPDDAGEVNRAIHSDAAQPTERQQRGRPPP